MTHTGRCEAVDCVNPRGGGYSAGRNQGLGALSLYLAQAGIFAVWLVQWFNTCAQLSDLSSQNQVTQELARSLLEVHRTWAIVLIPGSS